MANKEVMVTIIARGGATAAAFDKGGGQWQIKP